MLVNIQNIIYIMLFHLGTKCHNQKLYIKCEAVDARYLVVLDRFVYDAILDNG